MKIPDTGSLIDSRLYNIDLVPQKLHLYKPFKGLKAAFFEDFPKNDEINQELLSIRPNYVDYIFCLKRSNNVDYVQIQANDIVGLTEEFENSRLFLKTIYENYTPYDEIFKSVFVKALLEIKWYSYGFKLFVKEGIIFLLEVLYEQYGLEDIIEHILKDSYEISNIKMIFIVVIGVFIIFYLLLREIKEFVNEGFSYFNSVKNMIDIFYIFSYGSFEILMFIMFYSGIHTECCPNTVEIAFILRSVLVFLFCIRGLCKYRQL